MSVCVCIHLLHACKYKQMCTTGMHVDIIQLVPHLGACTTDLTYPPTEYVPSYELLVQVERFFCTINILYAIC